MKVKTGQWTKVKVERQRPDSGQRREILKSLSHILVGMSQSLSFSIGLKISLQI